MDYLPHYDAYYHREDEFLMSDVLVSVENVSKKFCRSLKKSLWYGVQDMAGEIFGSSKNRELRADEFWAIKDVSFELKRGECIGLIGRNGAGKTTLLRILNGLIKPDFGRIEMRGRVGALIALGAGFNPILTGRENIYVNATVLGLSKLETDKKIDEIIDFAEIDDFIDSPVQNYSSGMQVRLGFAIASTLEPDIMLLDEVLTVGDASFRFKCYQRMDRILEKSAVIFVSHDMPQVARICERALLLDHGNVKFDGLSTKGIELYQILNEEAHSSPERLVKVYHPIQRFVISEFPDEIDYRENISFKMRVSSSEFVGPVTIRLDVRNLGGGFVASCAIDSCDYGIQLTAGDNSWRMALASLPLKAGSYLISTNLANKNGALIAVCHNMHKIIVRGGHVGIVPDCQLNLSKWCPFDETESISE
jgi:lipopolysaccharide transport system ATP-binding protein